DAIMFWYPVYRLNAILLFITAIISTLTLVGLYRVLPEAFSLKSPDQLQQIIDEQTAALQIANQKLKESEEQFKALVNNNPDLITLMSDKLEYKFVNDTIKNMSGLKDEDYFGKTPKDVLPDHPHTEMFTEQLQKVVDTKEIVEYEIGTISSRKGFGYFAVNMIPYFNKLKEIIGVITITKDVTSIRNNEKALNQNIDELKVLSKRLEYKRNVLQDFAYIVSHNLRSPTGNLMALINLNKKTQDPQKKEIIVEKIFDVASQLGRTVQELSEVVNINQNMSAEKEWLRFEDILQNQIISLSAQIMQSEATVSFDFSACEGIQYSKVYLESIFLNLLTNSLKYASPERKPVIFFSSNIDEKGVITLVCKDNGLGIDLNKYGNKIFSLHKTFHQHADSRGVGLFITKNQIKSMGGSISVESEPDKGASFIIKFNEFDLS
ncbi:MAG: sensor histidine kinase, partial [Chitinophagaceae bacterium]